MRSGATPRESAALLGDAVKGLPAHIHSRMQDLGGRGALPITTTRQRARQRFTRLLLRGAQVFCRCSQVWVYTPKPTPAARVCVALQRALSVDALHPGRLGCQAPHLTQDLAHGAQQRAMLTCLTCMCLPENCFSAACHVNCDSEPVHPLLGL